MQYKVNRFNEKNCLDKWVHYTGAKTAWNNQYADNAAKVKENEQKFASDYAATDADRQLNSKIRDKLSNGWFTTGYDAIILKTTNGVVVITGTVDTFDDIKKINEKLKGIEGVKSVNNQVTVKNK